MKFDIDHHQSIAFPFAFEIVEDSESALIRGVRSWPFIPRIQPVILILVGASGNTARYAEKYLNVLETQLNAKCLIFNIAAATLREARDIDSLCASKSVSLIVAIGGGTVIDVAKMVVRFRGTPLIVVPSVLSSDCIASPISVLFNEQGTRESLPSGIPSCIFVDLTLTLQAPLLLTLSGIGDTLSNASALLDIEDIEEQCETKVSGFAKILSRAAYEMILSITLKQLSSADGHRKIAISLVLSGMAMSFAGNSLPCSGAEHLISHAIDHLGYGSGTHGIQVGVCTVYCAALRDALGMSTISPNIRNIINEIGFPHRPEDFGLCREKFIECVQLAPKMRPKRITLLNEKLGKDVISKAYDLAFFS